LALRYAVRGRFDDAEKTIRPLIERVAEQARERVELGKDHIRKQRRIVAELKRDGHDTQAAERLLRTFEEAQALHKEHADRLSREAAAAVKRKSRGSA
jgi:uncharacterized protein HemY